MNSPLPTVLNLPQTKLWFVLFVLAARHENFQSIYYILLYLPSIYPQDSGPLGWGPSPLGTAQEREHAADQVDSRSEPVGGSRPFHVYTEVSKSRPIQMDFGDGQFCIKATAGTPWWLDFGWTKAESVVQKTNQVGWKEGMNRIPNMRSWKYPRQFDHKHNKERFIFAA